ncbi:MAG: hypothetical protein JOY90_21955 [Bradyrhizobium sp.]|uniref:hypothetical protein n=1 Tax=Bradyrhizobium sp. TaxID=376 RepID=UPI001DD9EC75|nr:hypothetical protein [Bradyrhizobium sp.]MBV9563082.1 hypothetical protein [Bradyrhizobium sp.]
MTVPPNRFDPLGRLAGALVEDILATPGPELLAQSAEDYGDARALAAEFEKAIASAKKKFETPDDAAGSSDKA